MAISTPLPLRLAFTLLLTLTSALKFDIVADRSATNSERCIRNFVAKDQLVVVTATVSGQRGDGQTLDIHVRVNPTNPTPLLPLHRHPC